MSTNIYYVYAYLREDGTPYYIGKGKENRIWEPHGKIGVPKNPSQGIVIKDNLSETEAFQLEKELILKYGRKDIGTGILRNMTNGGEGTSGWKPSQEWIDNKTGDKNGFYGKKHTEEVKKKWSVIRKGSKGYWEGKKRSEETKEKISKNKKGTVPWNKGKTSVYSEETKRKMSESKIKYYKNKKKEGTNNEGSV